MATYLRRLSASLSGSNKMSQSPSFNDFSMGCQEDADDSKKNTTEATPRASMDEQHGMKIPTSPGTQPNVWQGVFNPGRNPSLKRTSRNYYDSPTVGSAPSTWDYICKSESTKHHDEPVNSLPRDKWFK